MHLSFFGSSLTQADIRRALRHHDDDKNVNPHELAAFAREQGFRARVLVNGDAQRLKRLIVAGVPVLTETWLIPEPNDGMGHYRLIVGYDDATRTWITYDSYVSEGVKQGEPYRGIRLDYDAFDAWWKVFNRTYLVVYEPESAARIETILGEDVDPRKMWEEAKLRAEAEIAANPEDAFAWFNLGSARTALGEYEPAAQAFDQARLLGLPWRMLWYQFTPFKAYYETGRFKEVLALAEATLQTSDQIEEVYYWKGMALLALGREKEAAQAFARAEALNPRYLEVISGE